MAKKIFEIGSAPDSEVEGVKNALRKNSIKFYETPRGNFGKSMASLWIENDSDFLKARESIEKFQNKLRSKNQSQEANRKVDWKFLPLALLVVIIVLWMLAMGYTR